MQTTGIILSVMYVEIIIKWGAGGRGGVSKKILSEYLLNFSFSQYSFFYNKKVSNLCDTNVQFKFQMKRKNNKSTSMQV